MTEHLKRVKAHEVKPGDVVHLIEGPKQVRNCQYMSDNMTIKLFFYDGLTYKVDQFRDVYIERSEND